jgi:hypothetical protein
MILLYALLSLPLCLVPFAALFHALVTLHVHLLAIVYGLPEVPPSLRPPDDDRKAQPYHQDTIQIRCTNIEAARSIV